MNAQVREWLNSCCEADIINGAFWDAGRDDWVIWDAAQVVAQYHDLA